MTAPHDLDRHLQAFLTDGPTELPDPSFDAVRDRIESTRQRTVIGPWRMPDMNKLMPVGLGAGAVVVALVVGTQLLPLGSGLGAAPPPSPTPTVAPTPVPTATTSPSPSPSPTEQEPTPAALGEGPFVLVYEQLFGVRMTVTIPAPDWHGFETSTILEKGGIGGPPRGAELVVYGGDMFVYGDPCAWESTRPDDPAASLAELVATLSAQISRDVAPPEDATVGGYPGKKLVLRVPEDAVFTGCDGGEFRTLVEVSSSGDEAPRSHPGPGQISEVWVVDVDGTLVFIDAGYFADTPAEDVEEMRAIVGSATFEVP